MKLCVIRGTASAVLVAKESILQSVREHAQVKTEEISASQVDTRSISIKNTYRFISKHVPSIRDDYLYGPTYFLFRGIFLFTATKSVPGRVTVLRDGAEILARFFRIRVTVSFWLSKQKLIDYLAANENAKLREVCGGSGARIYIDRAAGRPASLLVRGSHDQVSLAKKEPTETYLLLISPFPIAFTCSVRITIFSFGTIDGRWLTYLKNSFVS